jgi:hypothetical protein
MKMRTVFFGVALLAASTVIPAQATTLDASMTFRGALLITAVTANCDKPGFPFKGETLLSAFRPKIAADATVPPAALLITFQNGAQLSSLPAIIPSPASGTYNGIAIQGLAAAANFTGHYSFTISPASIVPATPQISISGSLENFRNTAGCTVSFKGALVRGVI